MKQFRCFLEVFREMKGILCLIERIDPVDHYIVWGGWLGRAMVLGSFQRRGVLLLWHMVGQGPAVLAAGAGWEGYFFYNFSSRLSYLPFLMPDLLGDGWTF